KHPDALHEETRHDRDTSLDSRQIIVETRARTRGSNRPYANQKLNTANLLPLFLLINPYFFFFQAEDGIRDGHVTGVQTCALPIFRKKTFRPRTIESRVHTGHIIERLRNPDPARQHGDIGNEADIPHELIAFSPGRSEERRVGKECRTWWTENH